MQDLAATAAEDVWVGTKSQGLGRALISFLLGFRAYICMIGMMLPYFLPSSVECPGRHGKLREHNPVQGISLPHACYIVRAQCCLLVVGQELGKRMSEGEGRASASLC